MSYSFLLRKARKRSRITLRKAADYIGVSPATLERYENGEFQHIPADRFRELMRLYDAERFGKMEEQFRRECEARYRTYALAQDPPGAESLFIRYTALSDAERERFRKLMERVPAQGAAAQTGPPGGPYPRVFT